MIQILRDSSWPENLVFYVQVQGFHWAVFSSHETPKESGGVCLYYLGLTATIYNTIAPLYHSHHRHFEPYITLYIYISVTENQA